MNYVFGITNINHLKYKQEISSYLMKKIKINPRKELISLLRGYFSLPIQISLNRAGIIKDILKKDLNIKRYKELKIKTF